MLGRSHPLTPVGILAVFLAVVGYIAGWQLGWVELLVLASTAAVALLVALPFVVGRLRVDIERRLSETRVVVGRDAQAHVDVVNPRAAALRPRFIEEFDGRRFQPHRIPRLAGHGSHHFEYPLPTDARGRYRIGPAVIAKSDPLGLMRREIRQTGADEFWVHPRHDLLNPLPVGFAKDLEGPTSDTSPLGDVAFHSLREYVPGDDYRHIHWMSTARTGTPMVRHYVDNRRPHLAVLLDDRSTSLTAEGFETAVEIVASIAVSSLLHHEPVAVWTTSAPLFGESAPGGSDDVLDRLTTVVQGQGSDLADASATMLREERGTSAVAIVTGPVDTRDLLMLVANIRRRARLIVVRVWPAADVRRDLLPGARLIDVSSRREFSASWESMVR